VSESNEKYHYEFDDIGKGRLVFASTLNLKTSPVEEVKPLEPTCFDGVLNGYEGDIDCGGYCVKKCLLYQTCHFNRDCETNKCLNLMCNPVDELVIPSVKSNKLNFTNSAFFLVFVFVFVLSVTILTIVLSRHKSQSINYKDMISAIEPVSEFKEEEEEKENIEVKRINAKEEMFDSLVIFAAKVMAEHDEGMVRKLFDKRGYDKQLQEKIILEAKSKKDVADVAIDIEKCEDDYNLNFESSMTKKEEMMKLRKDIDRLKERFDEYE